MNKSSKMLVLSFLGFISLIIYEVRCAKILGVFHSPANSHYMAGSTLAKILAERGHEITVMSPFSQLNPPKNYEEIYLDGLVESQKYPINFFTTKRSPFSSLMSLNVLQGKYLNKTMSHTKFQELLRSNSTFDLVIVEQFASEALMYLAIHFKAPLIGFSTLDANSLTNRYVGNPTFLAYIPDISFPFHRMDFWERLQNVLMFVTKETLFQMQTIPIQNEILQENIPGAPHITSFLYNITSLTFLNSDSSFHDPIPKVPSMINIGGFHVDGPKALPADLQKILDDAVNGVIYFSMGTGLHVKDMPKKQLVAIFEAFSKMKETILWKCEDADMTDKPKNIVPRKWLPQQDILAHKNVKLFITHGGLFSVIESIYYGVPMLIIPIKSDQYSNAIRAVSKGYAKSLEFLEISSFSLEAHLNELLGNPKFRENAMRQSSIMRDKPMSARDSIVFWVENVILNRGAPHLEVASLNLSWYQYFLIDVIAFILLSAAIFIISVIFGVRFLIQYCSARVGKEKIN